ncbi:hypothetical protein LCGC14_2606050, partial [marine sediment metagenome]
MPEAIGAMGRAQAQRQLAAGAVAAARAAGKRSHWPAAVASAEEALRIYPGLGEARVLLEQARRRAAEALLAEATGLLAQGRADQAERRLRRALGFQPDLAGAQSGLAGIYRSRGDRAAEAGHWGRGWLWYAKATEALPSPADVQRVEQARRKVFDRISLAVHVPVTDVWGGRSDRADSLGRTVQQELARRTPPFVKISSSGPPDKGAMVATVVLGRLDVRTERTGSTQHKHVYTWARDVPNPELDRLRRDLGSARRYLMLDLHRYRRRCTHCRGTGRHRCKRCAGTGKVVCNNCQGKGKLTCKRCGGDGIKDNGEQCKRCKGTGQAVCLICKGTTRRLCPQCSRGGERRGWVVCPRCRGTGRLHRMTLH